MYEPRPRRPLLTALCAVCVTLVLAPSALAQDAADPYEAKVVELLEKTGARAMGRQMGTGVFESMIQAMKQNGQVLPDGALDILRETSSEFFDDMLAGPDFVSFATESYRKHFSLEDLEEIVAFYDSPVGKKLIATLPEITAASLAWGQKRATELLPDFQAEVARRLIEAGFGPKPNAQTTPDPNTP